MLDWVIDVLDTYRAKGSAGEFELALTVAIPLISAILAIAFAAGKYAQWRYRKDIAIADELRQQLAARFETVKDRDKEIGQLNKRIEILESQTATGFLKKMNREAQDGNFEREVAHSEQYLTDSREALHRAFTILMKEAIAHAPEDGAPGFENARLFALAGIVINPDDSELRELAEELRQAAGAAAGGAKVALKSDNARKERRAQKEVLPDDLDALEQCWNDADEKGHYQMVLGLRRPRTPLGFTK